MRDNEEGKERGKRERDRGNGKVFERGPGDIEIPGEEVNRCDGVKISGKVRQV